MVDRGNIIERVHAENNIVRMNKIQKNYHSRKSHAHIVPFG